MKVKNLNSAIAESLKAYTKDVEKDLEVVQKKVVSDGVRKIKQKSPVLKGTYASGWKMKKVANGYVIYNAKRPGLTHLLENGHAKRGGGRVKGIKHIEPVEQEIIKDYLAETERVLKK
ncbi:hypothetical protein HCJ58_01090 [Listeria sp. FSL L7-1509]|uniref:HK97 gp10 family phage protein n=1 Tax=Listeria immobilis TaxID=2713502 RepID=A0ABR6STH6_9LIST|nr:HK97 gp10 family phage protein [Listeria immobilis]MBC1505582.1 hypothetical protein [Listeria immobilis]MBC1508984.1 hypothetical protein [Listeria immobilis]MBC6302146.1 hypothetical protein [Listeria immobilis]